MVLDSFLEASNNMRGVTTLDFRSDSSFTANASVLNKVVGDFRATVIDHRLPDYFDRVGSLLTELNRSLWWVRAANHLDWDNDIILAVVVDKCTLVLSSISKSIGFADHELSVVVVPCNHCPLFDVFDTFF